MTKIGIGLWCRGDTSMGAAGLYPLVIAAAREGDARTAAVGYKTAT
jgi:hypothetical protein